MSKSLTPEEIEAEIARLQELLHAKQARTKGPQAADPEEHAPREAEAHADVEGGASRIDGKERGKRTEDTTDIDLPDQTGVQAPQGIIGQAQAVDPADEVNRIRRDYDDRIAKPAKPSLSSSLQGEREGGEGKGEGDSTKSALNHTQLPNVQQAGESIQSLDQTSGNIGESGATGIAHTRTLEMQLRMETATEMCRRVADGESMTKMCKEADMPAVSTFLRWCHDDSEIAQMYIVALKMRAAGHAELLHEDMEKLDQCTEPHEVAALKVKINTRQWIMSRLLPKQYGDHQIIEHTGEVKLDQAQVDARLQHLIGRITAVK